MSRVIKFRVWIKIAQQMGFWDEIVERKNLHRLIDNHEYPLMQFTGLTDKNGVDIYEGDIVMYRDTSGSGRPREFGPREVRWHLDSCNFNVTRPVGDAEIEIIGNIHSSPELLK